MKSVCWSKCISFVWNCCICDMMIYSVRRTDKENAVEGDKPKNFIISQLECWSILPYLTLPYDYKKQLMIGTSLKMKRNSQVFRDVECTLTRTTKSSCPLSMPCLAAHSDPILWQIQNCQNHLRAGPARYGRLTGKVHTPYINKDWEKIAKGLLIAISWRWCDRAPTRAALHCAVCVDTDRHPNGFRGFLSLRHTPAITIGRTMGI